MHFRVQARMTQRNNNPKGNEMTMTTNTTPRIYVASLSDYNAGRLHGTWIDVDGDADDIQAAVDEMLTHSPETLTCQWCGWRFGSNGETVEQHDAGRIASPDGFIGPRRHHLFLGGNAEEWAIHDYEGFGGIRLDEYTSFTKVAAIAEAITEHDGAFAAFYGITDTYNEDIDDIVARFGDEYQGHFESAAAFAEEWAVEMCGYIDDEHPMFSFIDWSHYANGLDTDGFYFVDAGAPEYGVYVFTNA